MSEDNVSVDGGGGGGSRSDGGDKETGARSFRPVVYSVVLATYPKCDTAAG